MNARNNCHFIGNLGRDVETRYTQSGTAMASFSLPVEAGHGDKKTTTWVRCVIFGKRAEGGLIQYLTKGQTVAVTGEIRLNQYTGKGGEERSSLELFVSDIALIGKRSESKREEVKNGDPFDGAPGNVSDSIPF